MIIKIFLSLIKIEKSITELEKEEIVDNGQHSSNHANNGFVPKNLYQGNDFVIATSGTSPAQTSYYRDGMATAAEAWGYITGTPMVRMNFNPSVGINETASNTFKVYPNPTSDIVNIKFTDATNATISVMSLSGREVMTSVVNGTQASFSTEGLSNGVYVIKVSNGTNIQMTKVVIRK